MKKRDIITIISIVVFCLFIGIKIGLMNNESMYYELLDRLDSLDRGVSDFNINCQK